MRVTAIIAAAGEGRRLGAAVPKQLLELDGRSILERSVDAFAAHPAISETIVVLPADLAATPPACWPRALPPFGSLRAGPATGFGRERFRSGGRRGGGDPHSRCRQAVCDVRRDFARHRRCRAHARRLQHPGSDTVKRAELRDGQSFIADTVPRDALYLAQTPQGFARPSCGRLGAWTHGCSATDRPCWRTRGTCRPLVDASART